MKSLVTALGVCTLVASLSAGQATSQQQQAAPPTPPAVDQQKATADVTLTGCLVQGSTPAVFIFENVRKDPSNKEEAAVKYIVSAGTEDLNLRNHLNHQVRISGAPDGKVAPPTASKVEEKDLPKLSAKSITMVAD